MARDLPPLNPLRAFEAAARHRSMSKAAAELSVTQAAISRQVRVLEHALNVRLFDRLHRTVELTPAGARYFAVAERIFGELEEATRTLTGRQERRQLRICGYNTFNLRWLVPRLAGFHARYPDIRVKLSSFPRADEGTLAGYDGVIQTGSGHFRDATAIFIAPIELSPVCTPDLAADLHGPADLRHHTLLHSANRQQAWGRWLAVAGLADVDPDSGLVFDNGVLCYQAALEGIGIALAEEILVADDVRSGRLVRPFDLRTREELSYYFLQPTAIHNPSATTFGAWLRDLARHR